MRLKACPYRKRPYRGRPCGCVVKAAEQMTCNNACLLYRSEASSIFASLVSIGFSQKMCLPVCAAAHDEVCMRCGGGADEHGLDGRIAKDHLRIIVTLLNAHVRCPCAGRIVHERISHCVGLRSARHVPDFRRAACRFCLHQADRFLPCFPFFLASFFALKPD